MIEEEALKRVKHINEMTVYGEPQEAYEKSIRQLANAGYGIKWDAEKQEYILTDVPDLSILGIRKPGRPTELQGEYELVSVKIRKDLLAKIKASGKSRREYIEELLEK